MPQELPVACTLNAADLAGRERLIADLGRDALLACDHRGTRGVLRFAAGAGIRERVDGFVAGESRCCAFLEMSVAEDGEEVVLTIDAPADAESVLAELLGAFGPGDPQVA